MIKNFGRKRSEYAQLQKRNN